MVVAILIYNNSILKIYIKSQTQIISQDCSNERYHSNVQQVCTTIDKVLIAGKLK